MGNGTMSQMMLGQRDPYYDNNDNRDARRPRLPRTEIDQREDAFYNGPRLRDYNEDLDPKSWGDSMKRHLTSPYVSDMKLGMGDKHLPRFNKSDAKLKLYSGTEPYPGETDTDRISSASKSKKKKSKKKREEEMLLNYKEENSVHSQDSESVSQGTQTATISSNFDDFPTTLPLPVHYRNEKYVTRDIGTQARDKDSNGSASMKRRYKKNTKSPKNQRKAKGNPTSYRPIPPDYNDELERGSISNDSTVKNSKAGGLQLDSQGNLSSRYPWDKNKRRKSVDSDLYSGSDRSRSSTGSRRKADPINKDVIDAALRNYGTVGRVEALELKRDLKEAKPDNEEPVKIPRPLASPLVKEGSMRYPVPDYAEKRKIDVPRLTATRAQLRSIRTNSREYTEESCQVPEDTFKRSSASSPKGWDELEMPDSLSSDMMPDDDDVGSMLSPVSEKSEVKSPKYDFAEKIKEIYEELKPRRKLVVSTVETQTDYVEPIPTPPMESEVDEPEILIPTPEPEPEPEQEAEPELQPESEPEPEPEIEPPAPSPTPTPPPTPPPPKPVMVDTGTDPQPVYEHIIIPQVAQLLYDNRKPEAIVFVESVPEPTPCEPEPSEPEIVYAEKEIQADPNDIDDKPKIRIPTEISIQPDAELQDLFPERVEKAIQTGYSMVEHKKLQASVPVDECVQTDLLQKFNKKLQADRKPRLFNRGSQASLVSEDMAPPQTKILDDLPQGHNDMDGDECHSIASDISTSTTESVKSENPYQPLSYAPPPTKLPQPKSWGTTARVENIYSGLDGLRKAHPSGTTSPTVSDTHSQGVQTTTTLDTRAASMIRKLGDLESLSGILDLEPEDYASSYGDGEEFPDVVNDTMSVKSGFSVKTF